jgi:hypothetical protein
LSGIKVYEEMGFSATEPISDPLGDWIQEAREGLGEIAKPTKVHESIVPTLAKLDFRLSSLRSIWRGVWHIRMLPRDSNELG